MRPAISMTSLAMLDPHPALLALGALALASVCALVWAYRAARQALVWPTKIAAASSFVAAALVLDATASAYGSAILAGLTLSWLGDVLLIPRRGPYFLFGLVAFLLGHLAYLVAFALRGLDPLATSLAALGALAVAAPVLRWLLPHVAATKPKLRAPVIAYVAVISAMIAAAAGTVAAHAGVAIGVGALGFYLSDLAVARNRFVAPGFVNKLWGTPLYFAAQWLLALSVA